MKFKRKVGMQETVDVTSSLPWSQVANVLAGQVMELQQISATMRRDQVEIDRLKAESQIITAHTDTILSHLRVQLHALANTR